MSRAVSRLVTAAALLVGALFSAADARAAGAEPVAEPDPPVTPRLLAPPDDSYVYSSPRPTPDLAWLAFQLLPSPQVAFGNIRRIDPAGRVAEAIEPAFGLRWQTTPLLYSFGVHRKISPWRSMVIDPIARVSGSIELHATFDLFLGHLDTLLVRPGVRTTLPLLHRGEYLAFSFGTSMYRYDGIRVAYDAGLWFLSGFVGIETSVAPAHDSIRATTALHFRVMH